MLGPMRARFESFNDFRYFFGYTRADGRTAEPRSSTFEENIERDRSARTTMTDVGRRHRTVHSPSAHTAAAAGLSAGVDADALHLPLPDGFCSRWSSREAMKAVALARECRADEPPGFEPSSILLARGVMVMRELRRLTSERVLRQELISHPCTSSSYPSLPPKAWKDWE